MTYHVKVPQFAPGTSKIISSATGMALSKQLHRTIGESDMIVHCRFEREKLFDHAGFESEALEMSELKSESGQIVAVSISHYQFEQ